MAYLMCGAVILGNYHFLDSGAEICRIFCYFVSFLENLKTLKKDILKLSDL